MLPSAKSVKYTIGIIVLLFVGIFAKNMPPKDTQEE